MYCLVLVSIYIVSTATWLATAQTRHYTEAEVDVDVDVDVDADDVHGRVSDDYHGRGHKSSFLQQQSFFQKFFCQKSMLACILFDFNSFLEANDECADCR